MDASLLLIVGQTATDRAVVAAAWLAILALAAIVLVGSSAKPRSWR
ncbi:MAG TPA: hypothetical protein VF997_01920 [Polyangia bacterium]